MSDQQPGTGVTYRVMVVDDSAVIRSITKRMLETDPALKVVALAGNGQEAVAALRTTPVDVIVLDIEMPVMDGIKALPQLKAIDPSVQIIMSSTLTQKNAEVSLQALSLGAADYIAKPSSAQDLKADAFTRELIDKTKVLAAIARRGTTRQPAATAAERQPRVVAPRIAAGKAIALRAEPINRPDIIPIDSSTGGPQALFTVIKALGAGLPQPIVITQHMPPTFTATLAEHIARQCDVICAEAKDGEVLQPGHYYIAPGDYHLLVVKAPSGMSVKLTKDPPENYCRPAVDPMLRSLATIYGKRVLTVILTGMGQDGCKGGAAVVAAGGSVIAQDEASSVVWGMPGAVATAGLCSAVLPVEQIGGFIRQAAARAAP